MYLDFQQNYAVPSFTTAHCLYMWIDTDRQAESDANRHTKQLVIVNVPKYMKEAKNDINMRNLKSSSTNNRTRSLWYLRTVNCHSCQATYCITITHLADCPHALWQVTAIV